MQQPANERQTHDAELASRSSLVEAEHVKVHFPITAGLFQRTVGAVRAVDDVSFDIRKGETLGLVGESGCGKSTIGRALIRLRELTDGVVRFDGVDLTTMKRDQLRKMRRRMQIIFQDPYSSLNPRMTVGSIISEPIETHNLASGKAKLERVKELLTLVGLNPNYTNRYPHEFSGGQRQRIGVARSLAVEPEFIVCDEPISALDVSIQAQVLNLLVELREQFNLTYLFIAHDLSVVRHISDRVGVMYLGKIVELGPPSAIYETPAHPYTRALLSAVPIPDPRAERRRKRVILTGDVPSPANPPAGCRFHTRCWLYEQLGRPENCRTEDPELRIVEPEHRAACHYAEDALQSDIGVAHLGAEPIKRKPFGAGPTAHKPEASDSLPASLAAGRTSSETATGGGGREPRA
ncbi:MAG TPA: oligopeptide/dipeptide ABC transporter ATP-binding protein [Candidatus Limnocylindria bacterium]